MTVRLEKWTNRHPTCGKHSFRYRGAREAAARFGMSGAVASRDVG